MKNASKIENEIRGKFKNRKEMYEYVGRIGAITKHWMKRQRLSVIFTNKNKEGLDLQIRLHDLDAEIILKRGKHEASLRQEHSIKIPLEQFIPSIFLVYNLGFKKGVVANCLDWVFRLNGEEIKLTECDNKIFCWEIETQNKKTPLVSLNKLAKTLGLVALNESELKKYWVWMKKYGNKKFDIRTIDKIFDAYLKDSNERKE